MLVPLLVLVCGVGLAGFFFWWGLRATSGRTTFRTWYTAGAVLLFTLFAVVSYLTSRVR